MARAAAATTAGRAAPARDHSEPRRRPVVAPPRRPARRSSGLARPQTARGIAALPRGARVLDALLTGRAWIGLVGVLLAGIVFFNVDLLQMNREITRMADRGAELKRENARTRLDVAHLANSERIQAAAARLGLVLPAPNQVRYLRSNPKVDALNASKRIIAPSPGYAPAAAAIAQPNPLALTTPATSTTPTAPATTPQSASGATTPGG